jgi:hypothetical protein
MEEKKKRITRACDLCRKRHLRCDGENICYQCVSRGTTCTYSPMKRRGPKPKDDYSQSLPDSPQKKRKLNLKHSIDNSVDMIITTVRDYFKVLGPSLVYLDLGEAKDYWKYIENLDYKLEKSTDNLLKALIHSTVFAHGTQLLGSENKGKNFAEIASEILIDLFFKKGVIGSGEIGNLALETLTMLAFYHIGFGDFNQVRTIVCQALNMLYMGFNVPSHVRIRIFAILFAGCNAEDKHFWFDLLKKELTRDKSLYTRLFTILFFPIDFKKMECIFNPSLFITNHEHKPFIKDFFNIIEETEQLLKDNDNIEEDQLLYARTTVYGTKSYLLSGCGYIVDSMQSANEAASSVNKVNLKVRPGSRVALMYSLTASLAGGNTVIYDKGISALNSVRCQYPLIDFLYSKLIEFKETKFPTNIELSNNNNQQNISQNNNNSININSTRLRDNTSRLRDNEDIISTKFPTNIELSNNNQQNISQNNNNSININSTRLRDSHEDISNNRNEYYGNKSQQKNNSLYDSMGNSYFPPQESYIHDDCDIAYSSPTTRAKSWNLCGTSNLNNNINNNNVTNIINNTTNNNYNYNEDYLATHNYSRSQSLNIPNVFMGRERDSYRMPPLSRQPFNPSTRLREPFSNQYLNYY